MDYDDHCTVVAVIEDAKLHIQNHCNFVHYAYIKLPPPWSPSKIEPKLLWIIAAHRTHCFYHGFLWPCLGFLCLWAGFLVSLCGIHLSPVLPMGFHRARTKHILLLSTGEEKNPTSATSGYKKNSLRFYGGRGDMMFLLVFGFYVCVCGYAGLYVCARVSACLWKL